MPKPTQNQDSNDFPEIQQEWNLEQLLDEIEKHRGKKLTLSEQRNLQAILLGMSPQETSKKFTLGEKSLKPSFSQLYRIIESLTGAPEKTVTYKNAPLVLAAYRKGATSERNQDRQFVGREEAIAALDGFRERGSKLLQIVAAGGQGKTTLARKYLQNRFSQVIEFEIAMETNNLASIESLIEAKLKQLGEEPGRELMISLERLKRKLQSTEIGILIDNLESALDATGCFIENHRSYVELFRVLSDPSLKGFSIITSRESLNEPSVTLDAYKLKGLSLESWQEYFQYQSVIVEKQDQSLIEMHKAFGGNAKAMDVLSKAIQQDYDGNIKTYWQDNKDCLLIEPTLENLIKEQFKRLKKLKLNDAYNLLCRLGCYRYQDVQTVPEAGLNCLLWDVAENQHRRIIKVLKERALVEFDNGEYWLHPVTREEAINRLINSDNWKKANTQAAEFWTKSVQAIETVKNALTAFEAYYHYLSIDDYNQAGHVIAKPRVNNFGGYTCLGIDFYTFGLLEKIINSIEFIIDKIEINYLLVRFYNIIGDLYWMTGKLNLAMKSHKECQKISEKLSNNTTHEFEKIGNLNVASLLNIGLCYIDLWDFINSKTHFEKTISLSQKINANQRYIKNSIFLLAYINSEIGFHQESVFFLNQCDLNFRLYEDSKWGIAYSFIFYALTCKNLKKMDQSFQYFQKAFDFSEEVNYPQVKGKALTGLAELYRIQNDIEIALTHHQQSIEILDKIGAKCDLAEAYFQLALTYQKMGDTANAQEYFDKAIYLWSPEQIDAPKQIERVKQAMNNNN